MLFARNGRTATEHLVENHAEAVDVGAAVDTVGRTGGLLRRHVQRGAGDDVFLTAVGNGLVEAKPEVDQDRVLGLAS